MSADEDDRAADFQQFEIDRALHAHATRAADVTTCTHCADCGEELNAGRMMLRARRCVDCQGDYEKRARHYAR
jgi:RNA polymerase-binding transcription factor DksA